MILTEQELQYKPISIIKCSEQLLQQSIHSNINPTEVPFDAVNTSRIEEPKTGHQEVFSSLSIPPKHQSVLDNATII